MLPGMKTLLVPLDFSDSTEKVLHHAAELAGLISAKIVLLHIIEPVASYAPIGPSMDMIATAPAVTVEGLSGHQQRLATLSAPLRAQGIPVEEVVIVGLPVDDIIAQAATHKADYIILGSHGHGAIYHLFSGSVVTGVLKHAVAPVIVVPVTK